MQVSVKTLVLTVGLGSACSAPDRPVTFSEIVNSPSAAIYENAHNECVNSKLTIYVDQIRSATDIAAATLAECAPKRFLWKQHLMERGAYGRSVDGYLERKTKSMEETIVLKILRAKTRPAPIPQNRSI